MKLELLPYTLISYLMLTIILELLLSIILGLRKKDLVYVILVNILTNPLLNSITTFMYIKYLKNGYVISIIILEILALLTEGLIYKRVLYYQKINPFVLSLILNIFSFLMGLLFNEYCL